MSVISTGVIGAGVFGRYHTSKAADHPKTRLVGVFDPNRDSRQSVADEFKTRAFSSADRLFDNCEAVIIAAPATYHGEYAQSALEHGCHILVEKPLATDIYQARRVVDMAESLGKVVQVGHQERFVVRAIGLDKVQSKPTHISAIRFNPFSPRGTDTSVTLDLMTHDLDLVFWLMDQPLISVDGESLVVQSERPDAARAFLRFPGGRAKLESSRVEPSGHREMVLTYPEGEVRIDFNAKTLTHNTPFDLNEAFADHTDVKDSLAAGLNEFVQSILTGRAPLITAGAGLRAVEAALRVDGKL